METILAFKFEVIWTRIERDIEQKSELEELIYKMLKFGFLSCCERTTGWIGMKVGRFKES